MAQHHSPLAQFEIKVLHPLHLMGYDISFTNASAWMVAAGLAVLLFLTFAMRRASIVPGRMQSMAEMSYLAVADMVDENVGTEGKKYFPMIFAAFMFVLFCNLFGMLPYSFTVTSHIAVTFALAISLFIIVTLIGFARHGLHFFHLFLPEGVPLVLAPLMIVIEMFTYLMRPFTLSIRLAANMMAGHTAMKVIAGFVAALLIPFSGFAALSVLPLLGVVALTGLELLVAVLQAYIFALLLCIYLNDAVNLH